MKLLSANATAVPKSNFRFLSSSNPPRTPYSFRFFSHVRGSTNPLAEAAVPPAADKIGDLYFKISNKNYKPMFMVKHAYCNRQKYSVILEGRLSSWKMDQFPACCLCLPPPGSFHGSTHYVVSTYNTMMFMSFGLYGLLLWDVATKEVKTIPEPDLSGKMTRNTRIHSGMGIDPVSGDYKVVRILLTYPIVHSIDCIPDTKAELYSFKTGYLKQIPYSHHFQFWGDPVCSVHINGSYYLAQSKQPGYIISFDFATEKFDSRLIPIPTTRGIVVDHFPNFHLVEFHGSLALVYNKWADMNLAAATVKESCPDFEIWVWNNESWSLVSAFDIPVPNPCFMGFFENDKLFIKDNDDKLLLFDLATRQLHVLGSWDPVWEQKIFPFVPGFLSTE